MPMEGIKTCAVPECAAPISGCINLCDNHRIPGVIVHVGDSTMVITAWLVERGDEVGIIFLNDWAVGTLFSGREGFKAKLAAQGFTGVRNLGTPEELEAAKQPRDGKKVGPWGGPWKTQYPWEVANAKPEVLDATGGEVSVDKHRIKPAQENLLKAGQDVRTLPHEKPLHKILGWSSERHD